MSQIKIYGTSSHLLPARQAMSDVIHGCVMEALGLPEDKRAHRFIPLDEDNFFMPAGRTAAYTIIEIAMIEGRTVATRKKLIRLLFERFESELGISNTDLEICIFESPACNWGFRGMHGDEIALNYEIKV